MGLFSRDAASQSTSAAGPPTPDAQAPPASAVDRTRITGSMVIDGALSGIGELLVNGKVVGSIDVESLVRVGTSGRIEADIRAASVEVAGTVNGDIAAAERILLESTARVTGRLAAPRIEVHDGARFDGAVTMNQSTRR